MRWSSVSDCAKFTSEALKALLQKLDSDKDFALTKSFYGSNFESAKQMELNEALKKLC
jgi:adenine-specific DNA-methyltransferase